MERYREREQTFDVEDDFSVAHALTPLTDLGAAVDAPKRARLRATYFDTDDLRLLHAGITLRRRTGGTDAGWHLKLPSGSPGDRTEVRLPLGSPAGGVPAELTALVGAQLAGSPLRPVLALDTERDATLVRSTTDGAVLEVADDHVVAERLRSGGVTTWREVEVERVAGKADLAEHVARLLEAAGARPARVTSKAARALGVAGDPTPPPRRRRPRKGDLLARRLLDLLGELGHQQAALRSGGDEAVHDLRVALRRIRSTLKTFAPLFAPVPTRALRNELSWLSDVLGEARDAEVLAARADNSLATVPDDEQLGPIRAELVDRLAGTAAAKHAALDAALASARADAALQALSAFAEDLPYRRPNAGSDRAELTRCVRREMRRLHRLVADSADESGARRDLLTHEARKVAKRVRYAAETLAPLDRAAAGRVIRRLTDLQDVLGERHDAVVAHHHYAAEGARAGVRAGENGYTYGLLAERERQAISAADAAFTRCWPQAAKAMRRFLR